jgi:hypothetical protein
LSRSDENTLTVWERKIMREILGPVKKMACGGSATIKNCWICVENQILSQKLEKEDYDG